MMHGAINIKYKHLPLPLVFFPAGGKSKCLYVFSGTSYFMTWKNMGHLAS